ncbi:MAG: adenosylcobinamide-phosphate synthase CbiB [Lautropia sp.]|nr:adenosylcobinamide-phosphate synthase CbiB [Lautropia sp.]
MNTLLLALVPVLALWIDHRWGEPPARWHPVVWIGHCLQWMGERIAPEIDRHDGAASSVVSRKHSDLSVFVRGALAWCLGAGVTASLAVTLQDLLLRLPWWLAVPSMALCLKSMLSWAMLRDEVGSVEAALAQSLTAGRERLGWLVSRDIGQLDETDVREAAIETLAENLNDSVVAPLFWFALLGLPGAVLYRFANTADAMWGYPAERHGRQWLWAGKWAARADDGLSWVPARLSALLLMLGAPRAQWRRLPSEARRTPSPNGGWPMAAMALRLGVRLGKPGIYCLNPSARSATAADTRRAQRRAARVVWTSVGLLAAVVGSSLFQPAAVVIWGRGVWPMAL